MYCIYLVTNCLICNSILIPILKMLNENNIVVFDKNKNISVWLDSIIIYLRKHETDLCNREILLHSCKKYLKCSHIINYICFPPLDY